MRKIFYFAFFLFSPLVMFLTSCSHNQLDSEFDMLTLRKESEEMASSIKWEQEIESSVLLKKINGADGLVKSLAANPQYIFASGAENEYEPVYPQIVGFASLDMTLCPESARRLLDEFCSLIASGKNAEYCMAGGCLYSLVLFKYDLTSLGYSTFSSYILGEPFVSEEIIQCPVRFLTKDDFNLDVCLYLKEDSPGFYKVHNIALKGEL